MNKASTRLGALALASALALAPAPSEAVAPALLLMGKEMLRQIASSMIKDTLLSGLSGMGCKGIALSRAINAFDLRRAAGGGLPMGLPKIPGGMAMPPDIAAKMAQLMPRAGQLPPGMAMDPAMMAAMAQMQEAMANPLSPPETLAVIDELFELGFLPKAVQSEFKECMVLVPESVQVLGMGMGMLKPMLPQLQQARRELHALPPAEQDELVAALAQEIKPLPADQRAALLEQMDSGFFPPRVAAGLKATLAGR